MTEVEGKKPIALAAGEKSSLIMIYSQTSLIRGEVVTTQAMRVSTWLRTPAAPEYMQIFNAHIFLQGVSATSQSYIFPEYYLPTNLVSAYHLVPPAADPIDYDPSEPNRKMEAVTILVGGFKFNGNLRMASLTDLSKYLNLIHETYMSVYDVDITNPGMPGMGLIHVPIVLVRNRSISVAARAGTAL
jgi:hypothetical protein